MVLTKRKRLRRRFRPFSSIVHTFSSFFSDFLPISLFLLCLTLDKLSLACGPGPGGGGGPVIGRRRAFSQAVDFVNGVSDSEGKLSWDISQWVPSNFQRETDQQVIATLNPNLQTAFGDIVAKSFDTGKSSTQSIVCPSDLTCDFSNWRLCRWRNSKQDDAEFFISEGSVDPDRLQLYAGTRTAPSSPFLLTAANQGDYKGWLVSDVIPEQPGDGTLEFRYWLTPLVELRVCTRSVENPDLLTCSDSLNLNGAPGPAVVTIPGPIREPFEIVFEVKNFVTEPGGLAFLDDIIYMSSLCDDDLPSISKTTTTASKSRQKLNNSQTQRSGRTSNICEVVPCAFDNNRTCGYNLLGPGSSVPWRLVHGSTGNRATGIQRDVNGVANSSNPYLLAEGERRGIKDLFIAQSQPFHFDRPISVRFFRHLLSSTSQLRVCLFDPNSFCPSTFRIDLEALDWQESVVDLNPSDIPAEFKNKPVTLLFVAEGLKQNNFVGIDNIEVRERNGSPAC